MEDNNEMLNIFGNPEDKSKDIIKVIGVGGGGCNAVNNMYSEGIENVTFAVCNTDSQSLVKSPVHVKIMLGDSGLGAGADPECGRKEAEKSADQIQQLLEDGTKMVFVTAGMGGGTGTGAGPVVAGIAKSMGILTIGIVTIPFYFEKKKKIIKALKGVEEMRKNVDALLIINNERLCDIYSDSKVSIKESFRRADNILCDATRSISELITVEGDINLDFRDVENTMRGGGGAIMAMGRASGERRVEKAVIDALDSPLLYGSDIDRAKRILFNISTSEEAPVLVSEMDEIDAFMEELDPNIEVIWGVSDDNSLGQDAKVTILATGLDDGWKPCDSRDTDDEDYYLNLLNDLYRPHERRQHKKKDIIEQEDIPLTVSVDNQIVQPEEENTSGHYTETTENKDVETSESTLVNIGDTPQKESPATRRKSFVERLKERIEQFGKILIEDEA